METEEQNPNEIMLFEIFCAFRELEDKYIHQAIEIAYRELKDRKVDVDKLFLKFCNEN